jgi:uncharacterized protein (DUF1015 family)
LTPDLTTELEANSPYNIVRLIKPPPDGGPDRSGAHYQAIRSLLDQWTTTGVIAPDSTSGFYPYSQTYSAGADRVTRHGFIALGDIRDAGLFTHEATRAEVREDRSRLRLATAADLGLIFTIYSDPAQTIDRLLRDCEAGEPVVTAEQPDGSTHRLYRCADRETTERIRRHMEDFDCVIADGHHRTAAAFDAWKENGNDAWAHVMMAFFNAESPGMSMRPIHRAVTRGERWRFGDFLEGLADHFNVQELPVAELSAADLASRLEGLVRERRQKDRVAFAMITPEPELAYVVEAIPESAEEWNWPRDAQPAFRQLGTAIFEYGILRSRLGYSDTDIAEARGLDFRREATEIIDLVRHGGRHLGFILPPIPLGAVFAVAKQRRNLPQKSTYFYPKLLTGLVVNRIDTVAAE